MSQAALPSLFNLDRKVAIITGSSKGIGAAIARGLAAAGAHVVISSRSAEAVAALAAELREEGMEATGIACHVGDEAQLRQLVEQTVATYGGVDILVNNAAISPVYGPLHEATPALFDKLMDVNVKAAFLLANYCYPHFKNRGGGAIINIASVEGLKPGMGLGLYSVSKAALIMLTKNQAFEWGADGVRANAICPGLIQTKFSAALWQDDATRESLVGSIPAGRMGQSEEMTGLALLLAAPAGSYCTGAVFTADGGYMIA